MILAVLGILDLFTALWLALVHLEIAGWKPTIALAMYLLIKGFSFRDIASKIDVFAGLYMSVMSITNFESTFLSSFFIIWLVQKGLASIFL